MGFSNKILIFFKIAKGGKFAVECVSNGIISLNCLSIILVNDLVENQKIFKFGKIGKND